MVRVHHAPLNRPIVRNLRADPSCTFLAFHPESFDYYVEIRAVASVDPDPGCAFAGRSFRGSIWDVTGIVDPAEGEFLRLRARVRVLEEALARATDRATRRSIRRRLRSDTLRTLQRVGRIRAHHRSIPW